MSRARELSKLGNPNVITADTSFNVGLGTEVPTNPATSANTQIVSAGIVSAYQLYGDGSALTGVAATDNINTNNIEVSGITTLGSTVTIGSAVTFQNNSGINVTGVITATSFDGDGSALTGLPAGLGTALATSGAGANIYYTNEVLAIDSNLTTDIPSTSDLGYTQYQELAVGSGAELTVADGDQLLVDVLGLTTSLGASTLTGSGGVVRANNFTNRTGGAPTFPDGINVTAGVGTFAGNVSIAGTLTYEDVTNVDSVGVITARAGISLPDDKSITLGGDDDLEIHHAGGGNSYIKNNTGELQIRSVFNALFMQETFDPTIIRELRKKLSFFELFRYYLPFKFLYHYLPREKYHQMAETIMRAGHSHEGGYMLDVKGRFETILDVYDQFDPLNYASS